MRSPEGIRPRSLRFNITPLIDVVFLLIVFFVMSNRMIHDEVAMELTLPRETSGETLDESDKGKIIVNVESTDVFYFGTKRVDLDELRERLLREKARATRETSVRIRANRDVPYGAIEPIMVLCAKTGFTDVSFAVVDN